MATMNQVGLGLSGASGTGNFAGNVSPSFTTPALGTPSAGVLSGCTGYAQSALTGLGSGVSTWLGTPSSANLAAAVTDETGSGALVFANTPTLVTPVLGVATATSLVFNPTTNGIIGTPTNNNAAAGSVGEFVSSIVASGAPVTVTSNGIANVTTISLTAGDWDVWGNIAFVTVGSAAIVIKGWVSSTSATSPDLSLVSLVVQAAIQANNSFTVPQLRFSLSGTTTIYLSGQLLNTSGDGSACGAIYARRVR